MRKRIINYISVFVFIIFKLNGQDIHFSQFYVSPILLNPAAAGASNGDYRIAVNYKNQWKSVINPFKTAAAAFDTKLFNKGKSKNYFGLGISLFNDKVGVSKFTTNQANIDIAYHVALSSRSRISAGIKTGFFQKYMSPAGLRWDSQYDGKDYDASRPTGENMTVTNNSNFDLGAGLLYTYTKTETGFQVQGGGAVAHITQPKNSFSSLDESTSLKITAHANIQYRPKDKKYMLLPSALFVKQGGHLEIVGGSNIAFLLSKQNADKSMPAAPSLFSAIHFGAFYRYKDAVIFVAALEYKKNMRFGVSYDFNVSRFTAASQFRGGPEFSFVYTGLRKEKKKPVKDSVVATLVVPAEKPAMAVYSGSVFGENDKPLKAQIVITPLTTDTSASAKEKNNENRITRISDSTSGKYDLELKPGSKYKIRITSPGFVPFEEEVDHVDLAKYTETKKDFRLTAEKPVPVETPTVELKPEPEKIATCNGKPDPDFAPLKGRSLHNPEVYKQMLALFDDYCAEGLNLKIQIAAYPHKRHKEYDYTHLKQFGAPEIVQYPDGLTRFTIGEFKTVKDAEVLRQKAIASGQKDAWITVFIKGKRYTLEELIASLSEKKGNK